MNIFKFNPLTSQLDLVNVVPEVSSDPSSPNAQDAWVLKTSSGGSTGGGKIKAVLGLGFLALTVGAGGSTSYKFSYQTKEGSIVRTTLA